MNNAIEWFLMIPTRKPDAARIRATAMRNRGKERNLLPFMGFGYRDIAAYHMLKKRGEGGPFGAI